MLTFLLLLLLLLCCAVLWPPQACRAAHADLRPSTLTWSEGELLDASSNRSPTSYLANPEAERALYKHDVDKDMTLLRIAAAGPQGK